MKRIETNVFEQVEDRPGMVRIVGRKKPLMFLRNWSRH